VCVCVCVCVCLSMLTPDPWPSSVPGYGRPHRRGLRVPGPLGALAGVPQQRLALLRRDAHQQPLGGQRRPLLQVSVRFTLVAVLVLNAGLEGGK